ncbi:hypothetical protein ASG29_03445 [Sphingomonas sp. Leaf412]|nr:PEPxxWA-CTERM sorting domain-containing protein [Sphingomonas sp. Leaf412]KQT35179.1 hypothetical protein ASG29_03445 [Sphingomonas sp. Leaf412]
MTIVRPLIAAAAVAVALPHPALAADLLYSLAPTGGPGYRASWRMPATPEPTQWVVGEGFAIERVAGDFPRSTGGEAYLDFFSAANGGGLTISDADGPRILATLFGAQLYTGSEAAPTMLSGSFTLTAGRAGGQRYTLRVVDAAAAVPEPATWLMMIAGFGLVGGMLRTRYRVTVRRPASFRR